MGQKRDPKRSQHRTPNGAENWTRFGAISGPFCIKNVIKNQCKNQCQKSMEIHEISTKNHPKIEVEMYPKA